jgi:hypothetical protein
MIFLRSILGNASPVLIIVLLASLGLFLYFNKRSKKKIR